MNGCRWFAVLAVVLALAASTVRADNAPRTYIVRSASLVVPALKYRLLPPAARRQTGNAATFYMKAGMLFAEHAADWDSAAQSEIDKWLVEPPGGLPEVRVHQFLGKFAGALGEVELGSVRTTCDWQLPTRDGVNPVEIQLPELRAMQALGRLLALRSRLQLKQGNPEGAVNTLAAGFAMARHVAAGDTLIHSLVAANIARTMLDQVESFSQGAGMPNLYWAVVTLPSPLVDLRSALEYEVGMLDIAYPQLELLRQENVSAEDASRITARIERDLVGVLTAGEDGDKWTRLLRDTAARSQAVSAARDRLRSRGRAAETIAGLPESAILAMDAVATYDELGHAMLAAASLPYPLAREPMDALDRRLTELADTVSHPPLAQVILPSASRARGHLIQIDRQVAALACLEALRAYSAEGHPGLPDRLADLQTAPLPLDPVTGTPFQWTGGEGGYRLESPGDGLRVPPMAYRVVAPAEGE